jgi:branched-chain amino acid transport system ATP-binding protein
MSPIAAAPLLDARNLTRRFQGVVSVNNVSLTLARNEVLGRVGPNGAGKTTLINLISGTLAPDEGEVWFGGTRIDRLPPFRRAYLGIARTFQVMKPFPSLSVLENVTVGALFGKDGGTFSREGARESAREWLAFTGLDRNVDQRAEALGGPDRKRLELARALAMRPSLLLLDEVMAGLNASEVDEVIEVIRRIRGRGVGILVVEHVMRAIRRLSDRVMVLHHGEKIAEGGVDAVFANPVVVEAYLGKRRA